MTACATYLLAGCIEHSLQKWALRHLHIKEVPLYQSPLDEQPCLNISGEADCHVHPSTGLTMASST